MRNGQNKHHRMRGRNRSGKSHNPLTRVYESNGPDVKIRGTASHVAEKYIQLARDAQTSGDPVGAENYYQHAEHYFRLIAAAQEQFRQNPSFQNRPEGGDNRDESYDDGEEALQQQSGEPYSPQMQPYPQQREQQYHQQQQPRQHGGHQRGDYQPRYDNNRQENRPQPQPPVETGADIDRLPSFITGGQQPQPAEPNGHEHQSSGDRFPLHRRRRRRGPYQEGRGAGNEGEGPAPGESQPVGE
jgi:hypothetical protein